MTQVWLTEEDAKHWEPQPLVVKYIRSLIRPTDRVLELGPGHVPFARADLFVDWAASTSLPADRVTICDMNRDPLPFADKSFDFVYCRHTVEDVHNPFLLCSEMQRVAKAGYVETPSPISELCRGIDGGSPSWRGYVHHRYFVWENAGVLNFIAKYPMVEYLELEFDADLLALLRAGPKYWNSYFLWRDTLPVKHLQHDVDYTLQKDYGATLANAVRQSVAATDRFTAQMLRHAVVR